MAQRKNAAEPSAIPGARESQEKTFADCRDALEAAKTTEGIRLVVADLIGLLIAAEAKKS